jgi:glycosyltransferase involved in cell wall biosynthesis
MSDLARRAVMSVVVTTYNRNDALKAVLRALNQQTDGSFDVIVADDGSEPNASAISEEFGAKHVWQPHNGFRAAAIRNRAVEASRGDYLVFLDGDCIPRPSFIRHHRALAEAGWFVTGNRALLSQQATASVLSSADPLRQNWPLHRVRGGINRLSPFLTLPIPRKRLATEWKGAQSCNLGIWRSDFDRVGGFDEAYQGWGYEDSDFVVRLIHAGVKRKDGRFATGVVHLWHPQNDRTSTARNLERLQTRLRLVAPAYAD